MKDQLCRAFCNDIVVTDVPIGLAVSTTFRRPDGDAVGFYVVKDEALPGLARIEDDGQTIPYLEACGVDFSTQTRDRAFKALLDEYGAAYDSDECLVHTPYLNEEDLPKAAMRFVAMLLRIPDFLLLTQEHIETAFKEDAAKRIKEALGTRATISENTEISEELSEFHPDMIFRVEDRVPVALFFGHSLQRVYEAILLQMAATYEAEEPLRVVALLESESAVSKEMQQRAANRLAAVPVYKGDELAAIRRIEQEVTGDRPTYH